VKLENGSVLVTGGASGLGLACVRQLALRGIAVIVLDLPTSDGEDISRSLGDRVTFSAGDVTDTSSLERALDRAENFGPLRALVHCAGRGATVRVVERDGEPGSLETFESIINVNLVGTFNSLRLAAARMVRNEIVEGERGVCVLTASVAAWEGQVGQIPYASAKAGVVGMTLVAARDLARQLVRVCSIAPGIFDTPILNRLTPELKASLAATVPHPARLGHPDEFASLALHILENPMLNGEVIRLDGAVRMQAR
jgi:NAD(P)-dependent dehydrogenase (short-subunit alcohol dehydrogenase family)